MGTWCIRSWLISIAMMMAFTTLVSAKPCQLPSDATDSESQDYLDCLLHSETISETGSAVAKNILDNSNDGLSMELTYSPWKVLTLILCGKIGKSECQDALSTLLMRNQALAMRKRSTNKARLEALAKYYLQLKAKQMGKVKSRGRWGRSVRLAQSRDALSSSDSSTYRSRDNDADSATGSKLLSALNKNSGADWSKVSVKIENLPSASLN